MDTRPLSDMGIGEKGVVAELACGRLARQRFLDMGFNPGTEIEVVGTGGGRGMIVRIKGCCTVALGFGAASKILVRGSV